MNIDEIGIIKRTYWQTLLSLLLGLIIGAVLVILAQRLDRAERAIVIKNEMGLVEVLPDDITAQGPPIIMYQPPPRPEERR